MPTIYLSIKDELLEENDSGLVSVQMKCPEIRIKINQIDVIALVDTGSSVNGISEGWFNAHEAQLGSFEMLSISNTFIISAVGHKSKHIKKQILCDIEVNNIKTECVFLIIPGLVRDCIIGMNFLQQEGCVINIPENYINFVKQQKEPKGEEQRSIVPIFTITTEGKDIKSSIDKKLKEINGVEPRYLDQLKEILLANTQVFDDRPGRIRGYYHTFSVTDNTPYIQKGWPVPLAYQRAVDDEIRRMLEFGVIERANSPYINPLVTVIKKDGKVRLCLDARKLNSVTVPDFEGPPPINEILARCGQMNIMSTIDLTSSFWQIPLQEECRNYTGFLYNGKCYRFTVTPFGLSTSLASLTRGLDSVLNDEIKQNTIIYVDDCLCYSNSIKEHLFHLEQLLRNLKAANITVNLEKSQFFRKEIQYLGYCLSTTGIKATSDKIAAILNFPTPKNQKQLKGFLGLTNFYNKFTSKYAEATQPLLKLLQKGTKFRWDAETENQFRIVKQLFIDTVVLEFPRLGQRFFLQCDASKYAYGGQLYQLDENNDIAVIAFTSRTFKGAEKNYFTTEKELLSIVQCLKKFRIYILGQPLTIITDNKALTFLHKCHLNNSRITRWILSIQEYNFDIIHCKGKDNVVADILSRYPEDLLEQECSDDYHEYYIHSISVKLSSDIAKTLKNIGNIQRHDDKMRIIMNEIEKGPQDKLQAHYQVVNGKLYRKCKNQWKLYIPDGIKNEIIKEVHVLYGHVGSKKLYHTLKEHFTMDSMYKAINHLIKGCDTCQKCKDGANRRIMGETKPIIPKGKGELLSIDYYGPLPTSTSGVKYLLVMVDNFTKYVKLYAVRRATTLATLKRIQQYMQEHGKPQYVLTDNGTQFTSKKWTQGLQQLGITPKYTAIRNPCTNIAERWNRQLGNLFRIFVRERHTKWATYIKLIESCLNEIYQDTIEVTPFEAHFGIKPKRQWEKFLDPCAVNKNGVKFNKIYLRIKEKGRRQAERLNQNHTLTEFKTGDKVLVKAYHMSDAARNIISKFCELYEGPYFIKKKLGRASYQLTLCEDQNKVRGIFNARQLKLYHSHNSS